MWRPQSCPGREAGAGAAGARGGPGVAPSREAGAAGTRDIPGATSRRREPLS
jgi:hypothetical protein